MHTVQQSLQAALMGATDLLMLCSLGAAAVNSCPMRQLSLMKRLLPGHLAIPLTVIGAGCSLQ